MARATTKTAGTKVVPGATKKEVQAANRETHAAVERAAKRVGGVKTEAQPDPDTELAEVKLPKGFKLPKTLAACADMLYELKAEKSAAQKVVDEIEAKQKALQAHLINTLPKSQATGVSGKLANAKIVTEDVPKVEDWTLFYAHIAKTKSFDLLNKAVNKAAVKERWEAKKQIPGLGIFKAVKVSLTKV